jgi:hypothetical protein
MKNNNITLITLSLTAILVSQSAHSAPSYHQFYLSSPSKNAELGIQEALNLSLKGQDVFKCTSVLASPSASGTSLSLKAIKRPLKPKKELAQKD